MILPIMDSVEGAIGIKVYDELEKYLKDANWCYYKSNSEIINILGHYKKNLKNHLQNAEVLKMVSQKIKAGSLLRINLENQIDGIDVELKVIGSNGEDVYFKEKTRLAKDNIPLITQTLVNWLETYEKTIPYDGRIIGVLGDQFTVDIGKASHVRIGSSLVIRRPLKKKMHPLLKEVVEWEAVPIASASIVNVSEFQAVAVVKRRILSDKKIDQGDWVRFERLSEDADKEKAEGSDLEFKYPKVDAFDFGKLGMAQVSLVLGSGSAEARTDASREMGSSIYGADALVELWATRNFWGSVELGGHFGEFKNKSGTTSSDTNSYRSSQRKFKAGLKFLPMGFFYGPQVDAYIGHGKYSYSMNTSLTDGYGENSIGGIILGTRLSTPMFRDWRAMLKIDWLPFASFDEKTTNFGESDSVSSIQFELGGEYTYNPVISFNGSYQTTSNKASFSGSREISYKENVFKLGVGFSF